MSTRPMVTTIHNNGRQVSDSYFTSNKIFNVRLNGSALTSANTRQEDTARLEYRFWWFSYGNPAATCKSRFVCTKLDGNVCGDYGIRVSDSAGVSEICHPTSSYYGTVGNGKAFHLSLWHLLPRPNMQLSCYVWCTEDGSLPSGPGLGASLPSDFLKEVVS